MSTLGAIAADPAVVIPVLAAALDDESSDVGIAAASALACYGRLAASAEPQLLAIIERAVVGDYSRLGFLVAALRAVSAEADTRLREHFAGTDAELRRLALGILKDQESRPAPESDSRT